MSSNNTQASNRKFGIEIECYLPTAAQVSIGTYHRGLRIDWAPSDWQGTSDSSLVAGCPAGYKAVEIVSPVLAGEDGLVEIVYMVEAIEAIGGIVNKSCGLHIHVDAGDLNYENVTKIRQSFIRYEKVFYGLSGLEGRSRYEFNPYCKPSSKTESIDDRYQGCNLVNYLTKPVDRRTVEFRVWAGTLDVETIVTAVYMAVGLVVHVTRTGVFFNGNTAETFSKVWDRPENRIVPEEDASQLATVLATNVSIGW